MKEIKAYVKPHKLSIVTLTLQNIGGLTGMSVSNIGGFGRGRAKNAPEKITEDFIDYLQMIKIEIVCHDDLVEKIVSPISVVKNMHPVQSEKMASQW
ncbi:MAG: P-II family nitrogen regulator [Syntrophobacteraceae bacterium]|jgi:nitrogen regulatory protein P-II 1